MSGAARTTRSRRIVRTRQHVNPDSPFFEVFRGERPVLAPGREVELEIGCAEAQFLFERAAQDGSRTYVGLEIREKLVHWVNRTAAELDLPVQAVFCHANRHLGELFPPASVARVYLNFPDPWFKRKHHERRMIDGGLVDEIAVAIRAGGDVLVQSDVWDIALDALAVFEARDDLFENRGGAWSFWKEPHPFGVRSWREQHCAEAGLPVWRILYRRR